MRAVDGVSLRVRRGETLGLVGESGCGKTTTGRAIMGLVASTGGSIRFDGQRDPRPARASACAAVRRRMQYVFQDPYSSLNPMLSVGDAVAEPLRIHGLYDEMGGDAVDRRSCSRWSACRPPSRTATPASSPAGRSSASASHARCRSSPAC